MDPVERAISEGFQYIDVSEPKPIERYRGVLPRNFRFRDAGEGFGEIFNPATGSVVFTVFEDPEPFG